MTSTLTSSRSQMAGREALRPPPPRWRTPAAVFAFTDAGDACYSPYPGDAMLQRGGLLWILLCRALGRRCCSCGSSPG
jgi:hypothetical protein